MIPEDPFIPLKPPLTGYLQCISCEYGPCNHKNNKKAIAKMGMPTTCLYGLKIYADFTAVIKGAPRYG